MDETQVVGSYPGVAPGDRFYFVGKRVTDAPTMRVNVINAFIFALDAQPSRRCCGTLGRRGRDSGESTIESAHIGKEVRIT